MDFIRKRAAVSFSLLYVIVGFGFAIFDMTLKQEDMKQLLQQVPLLLAGWPMFPLYDIFSGKPVLIAEGIAELAVVSPLFIAWYRITRSLRMRAKRERVVA